MEMEQTMRGGMESGENGNNVQYVSVTSRTANEASIPLLFPSVLFP